MNKTLLVTGLTPTTVGAAATEGTVDITEKVYGLMPTLRTPVFTKQYFSTVLGANPKIVEGKAKYTLKRKRHITNHNTTAALHDVNSLAGATIGDLSTSKFQNLKFDNGTIELNKSWELALVVDKKKDAKTAENFLYQGVGEELADKEEKQGALFYTTLFDDIDATTKKSKKYPTYVSSIDGKTKASPNLLSEVTVTGKDAPEQAQLILDAMYTLAGELNLMGRINSAYKGYPYARSTSVARGQKAFIIKDDLVPLISKDPRFTPIGKSNEIIVTGQVGSINEIPIVKDEIFDTTSPYDILLLIKGEYSPVVIAEELSTGISVFNHPLKPTLAYLVHGAGTYDSALLPYINLTRVISVIK